MRLSGSQVTNAGKSSSYEGYKDGGVYYAHTCLPQQPGYSYLGTSERMAIEPGFCYSPASRATWQTMKLGELGSGSNCLIYVLSCGLDVRMLSGISQAITQTPSATHQVIVSLIRLRWERVVPEIQPPPPPPQPPHSFPKARGQTLISKRSNVLPPSGYIKLSH